MYSQEFQFLPANTDTFDSIKANNKGKVILFNFWAYWCAPCKEEFPHLVELYENYKDKDFELVFVCLDFGEELQTESIPFLKEQGVDFTSYYGNFKNDVEVINYMDEKWEGGLPGTFVFDKEGKLSASMIGKRTYKEFENAILPLLD